MFRVESALWLSQERMLFTVGIKLYSKRRHVSIDLTVSKRKPLENEPRLISHLISLKHARIIDGG